VSLDKIKSLGETEVAPLLWRFSVPAVIGVLVNALYNVVDCIFVGQGVGEIGLTAVAIAFPITIVLMAIGMLVGLGASSLISLKLGEKDKDGAEFILGNVVSMIIGLVVFSTLLALHYLEPMLLYLGATPDVMPYATDFARIILAGSVFMHISFGLNASIQAQGDPKTGLKTMLIAALLNTILNPLLIFGFGLGIKGAAWATVIAQAVASVWVMTYFIRGVGTLKLRIRCLAVRGDIVLGIAQIGLAPFIMQLCSSLIVVIFNLSLLKYGGALAVAVFGVVSRIQMLAIMPVIGISQGAQPIIGYNYGAGRYHRVLKTVKLAGAAAVALCLISLICLEFFAEGIMALFNSSQEMLDIGATALRLFVATLPVVGFQIICANYFQAIGKPGCTIVLNLLRQVIVLIPALFILPEMLGLTGIWLAGPISDLGAALLTGVFMLREVQRLRESEA
jgi:putative MATE family efflux protein